MRGARPPKTTLDWSAIPDMPHRIRLRNWALVPMDGGAGEDVKTLGVTAVRHFNRPTNLSNCTMQLAIADQAPSHATLNQQPLQRCTQPSPRESGGATNRWNVPVEALQHRNCFQLRWLPGDAGGEQITAASDSLEAWLEIHDDSSSPQA